MPCPICDGFISTNQPIDESDHSCAKHAKQYAILVGEDRHSFVVVRREGISSSSAKEIPDILFNTPADTLNNLADYEPEDELYASIH